MLKKIYTLGLLFVIVLSISVKAQVVTKANALDAMAKKFDESWKSDYQKALVLAKKNDWLINKVYPNGRVISLVGLDPFGNPRYISTNNNTIGAATTRANQLWPGGSSGLSLSGSSNSVKGKLAIWDGGQPLTTHVELTGRVVVKDASSTNDHATHTSGTMIASGVNPIAKGMAYGAQQLLSYDFNNDQAEMAAQASTILISNHSYGYSAGWDYDGTNWSWYGDTTISRSESYGFGYYDVSAQAYDTIAYNAPNYLIVMSAGNERNSNGPAVGSSYLYNGSASKRVNRTSFINNNPSYGTIAYTHNAKNILTVGAVNGIAAGYNSTNDVVMSSFSSWGPTDDGRIKPDVVADGVNVTSSSSASNNSYESLDGTSMASPNAAGSLYLLQEYYAQKHAGNFLRGASLKALAIHTADEAGTSPGPDYSFGWGLLNVLKGSSVITASSASGNKTDTIIESSLAQGASYSFTAVASGNGVLTATIAWMDPAATAFTTTTTVLNNTTPRLINDLDIRITKGASVYKPWILDPNNPANPATRGDNVLDNVEKIQVDSTVPGQTYTVTVTHKGTLQKGPQAFSLIISGIGGTAYCTSTATVPGGAKIDSVVFGGIANKNTATTGYTNYTNLTASIEPSQTIPITVSVNNRDASSNPRVARVYIDYNMNGTFESTELVAQSAVINSSTGKFTANITTPATLVAGNYTLMRVIVQETSNPPDINPCSNLTNGEVEDFRVKFLPPSNNIALVRIASPVAGTCSNTSQLVELQLQNKGSVDKNNISLFVTIKNGATTIATISDNYASTLTAGSTVNYILQTPFVSASGVTYTFTATATITGDQDLTDNSLTTNIAIASKPSAPSGVAEICGTTVLLKVNSPSALANYLWYDTQTNTSPLATGATASTSTITSDKNYYISSGFNASVGPINKNVYSGGVYRVYPANTVSWSNYTSTVPVILNAVKLYSKFPGKFTITAADITVSGSSLSINSYGSQDINVFATSSTVQAGDGTPNDLSDSGAYYNVNLALPAGSHSLMISMDGNVSVYRNQNTSNSVVYPMGIPGLFQITGNNNTATQQLYYMFLYDMKISTADCASDRVAVAATTAPTPVITQTGNTLTSNITTGTLQWYLNGNPISGATAATYTATASGVYTIIVSDALGCQRTSNNITITITAVTNASSSEIGLVTAPNPASSQLNVSFTTNTRADVTVQLVNPVGQSSISNSYSNFVGQFNKQYNVSNLATGIYVLKVQQGNKVYRQKVIIAR